MAIFFVNTDAVSSAGASYHDEWIRCKVVVTGGAPKYRDAISRIKTGDSVLVYVNGSGVVAVGTAVDDDVLDAVGPQTVNPAEPIEYHKRVEWDVDLRANPIERAELIRLLGQGPMHAVQEVSSGKEQLLKRLAILKSNPTPDIGEYIRLADELRRNGRVERPIGVLHPQRTERYGLQFYRDPKVRAWALQRAEGCCEFCARPSPFFDQAHMPFLESHHIASLASGGPDTPENTAALCPNCHRELHFGLDRIAKSELLRESISVKESRGSTPDSVTLKLLSQIRGPLCGGQVFSDTSIDCCFADSRSKALGDKFPSVECSRLQL